MTPFRQQKTVMTSVFLLLLGLYAKPLLADTPPKELLEGVAQEMIASLNSQRAELSGNPKKVQALVEQKLLPHIDIINSSKWVLGKYWRRASKKQKIGFIKEFRTLLLRFYSTALAEYLDNNKEQLDPDMITFHPVKLEEGRKDITVRSRIKPKKGEPVPVHYHMHLTKKGWKVYDVSVEGVSVITTYKTSFASEIRQQGIDALIASLAERNKKLLAHNDIKNPFNGKKDAP